MAVASTNERGDNRRKMKLENIYYPGRFITRAERDETHIRYEIVFHDRSAPIRDNASGSDYLSSICEGILSDACLRDARSRASS